MALPQCGVLPPGNMHATFLTLTLGPSSDDAATVRRVLAGFSGLIDEMPALDPEASLVGVVGVGGAAWDRLFPEGRPAHLREFHALEANGVTAPSTAGDVFVHVRSDRRDLNFELCQKLMLRFGASATCTEEVQGFRYLDSRDLTGFVDGTENPTGDVRTQTALVDQGDPEFAGGSYISVQRYVHDLAKWNDQPVKAQEDIIGRTKMENIEYESADKPAFAHVKRSGISDESGPLRILRHSMPYGSTSESGLYFVAYCYTPDNFDKMLKSMIKGDDAGVRDGLLDYSQAVTGANYFAPSRGWLEGRAD